MNAVVFGGRVVNRELLVPVGRRLHTRLWIDFEAWGQLAGRVTRSCTRPSGCGGVPTLKVLGVRAVWRQRHSDAGHGGSGRAERLLAHDTRRPDALLLAGKG